MRIANILRGGWGRVIQSQFFYIFFAKYVDIPNMFDLKLFALSTENLTYTPSCNFE